MIDSKDNLIDMDKLNKTEKRIFVIFLKHEKLRHMEDIVDINKTINKLEGVK